MSRASFNSNHESLPEELPAKMPQDLRVDRLALKATISTPEQAAEKARLEALVLKEKYGDRYLAFKNFVSRYELTWKFSSGPEALKQLETVRSDLRSFDQLFSLFIKNSANLDFAKKLGIERMVEPQYMIEGALRELISDPAELSLIGLFALVKASGTPMQRTLQNTWAKTYFAITSLPDLVQTAQNKGIL